MTEPRVVVVVKFSAYRKYVEMRKDSLAMRLLAEEDPTVAGLRSAHEEHEATLQEVTQVLRELGVRMQVVNLPHQPYSIRGVDLVLTVGGDGTLLAASHQVPSGVPIVGINSAPSTSVGFFCGLHRGELQQGIRQALQGQLPGVLLARMEVRLNRQVISKRVLNDALFCHSSPAATSRYLIQLGQEMEEHKSSGFWIGPAAGSTAAQHSAGGQVLPLTSSVLQLVVREPFLYTGKLKLSHALIPDGESLRVFSKMREAKLFLDGPHTVVEVGLGDRLRFSLSKEPLLVLGINDDRGRTPKPPEASPPPGPSAPTL